MRRVAARLREHDWFSVAIEFALVVAGVFLGIQFANWNEARKELVLEATYLARIAEDVRSDVAEMDEIVHVSAARMALLNKVLPKASGRALPQAFESARGKVTIESVAPYDDGGANAPGFALFIFTPLEGSHSAYETMIHAGALANVHDLAMLRRVQDYYAAADRVRHFEAVMEQNRDKLVDVQRRLGLSPVAAMSVDEIAAAFAANAELQATAQNYWLYTNRHLKLMRALQEQARSLATAIDKGA